MTRQSPTGLNIATLEKTKMSGLTLSVDKIIECILALDYDGRMKIIHAAEEASGLISVVILSAEDIWDETKEDMQDEHFAVCEPGDKDAAPYLTVEMAIDICHSVAEDDWSDTNSEASWRAKMRLMKRARELRDTARASA